ncbi:MAG: sugar phosphate isomerase/epimerase [Rhodothermia bacterium]|nr:MAG: sugar phosphate isomerase/epimerase [Rhodothermia bacterium]
MKRRDFLSVSLTAAAGVSALQLGGCNPSSSETAPRERPAPSELFQISLAEWSLHRALRARELTNLDFPVVTRQTYGLDAAEYVNSFFKDKATDQDYLGELKSRADSEGVKSLLIMCDGEGYLGDPDDAKRLTAVENHYRWIDAAKYLGCHSIRVNAQSEGDWETQRDLAADGIRRLAEHGEQYEINVIVENHGGLSSNGEWLASVIRQVDSPWAGTLPDFGNFEISPGEWYDRYKGVEELMPFAKGVSAKSREFNDEGQEVRTDYRRMLSIVLAAGYRGYLGVEYEGNDLSEEDGINATISLLTETRDMLDARYQ